MQHANILCTNKSRLFWCFMGKQDKNTDQENGSVLVYSEWEGYILKQ